MKRVILSLCLSVVCFFAQAQHTHIVYFDEDGNIVEEQDHGHGDGLGSVQEGEITVRSFTGVAPRFGLAVQKNLFAEVGVSLDMYRIGYTEASEYVSFGYRNVRPYVSGEIMVGRKLIGGGKAGFEYIRATPLVGMAAGADVSYLTDGASDAVLLTPRVMLSILKSRLEVFYGYSFFLRNGLTRWVGHHRFGVSMTLNTRFWRRKNEMYNDYYNSYPQP